MIWRASLFLKYAIPLVVLVSGALVVSGLVEIYFSYQENKSALARIQHEKAAAAAIRIEQFVRELEHDLSWIAQTPWGPRGVPLGVRRLDSLRLLRQVPAITEVSHIDPSGHEQLRVSRLAMDVIGSNTNLSRDPKFVEAMAHKTYFSAVYFRKESEPYMTIALNGPGEDSGVVAAEANLKFILDVVSNLKVGKGGYAYVVDTKGRLIAHPDISLVLQKTDLSKLPQVSAAAATLSRDFGTTVETMVGRDVRGTEVLSAHAAIKPLNWSVFVDLPIAEAFAPLYASIWRTVMLVFVGVVISILASLFLVRRMVSPIHTLRAGAARIGAGALEHRISVRSGDELQALAEEFNRMTERLQESYVGLERKVDERTRDLSEALDQQTATSEILRVISQSQTDAQPVFATILASATRLCDASLGVVFQVTGDSLYVAAHHNLSSKEVAALNSAFPQALDGGSLSGRAILTRSVIQHVHGSDSGHYYTPTLGELQREVGFRATLQVPMLKAGGAIGVLSLWRRTVIPFSENHVELLKTFADQAVIAIENVRLFTQLEERNKSLTETLEQQTATSEILRVISSSPTDLQPVLDAVAKNAARLCGHGDGAVNLVEGDHFVVAAKAASASDSLGPVGEHRPIRRNLVLGRAYLDNTIIHIPNLQSASEDEFSEAVARARQFGYRAVLAVPMVRRGKPIGVLWVSRSDSTPFSETQIGLVRTFADQAVIAIENTRLFKELEQRNTSLTESLEQQTATAEILRVISSSPTDLQPVLNAITDSASRLCDAGDTSLFRVDGDWLTLVAEHGLPSIVNAERLSIRRDFVTGRAIIDRSVVHVADLLAEPDAEFAGSKAIASRFGYRTMLAAPLVRDETAIGVLTVRRTEVRPFSEKHIALLKTFADQAVIAIENARLFEELQDRTKDLAHSVGQFRALADVSQAVNSTLDLQQVLSAIVMRAVQLSGTDMGAVYERDEASDELRLRVTYGAPAGILEALLAKALPIGEGATGRAAQTRVPVEVADIRTTHFYQGALREIIERAQVRSILAIPLLREGRVLGSLTVSRKIEGSFPAGVVDILQTFAAQSAIAIQNARLFREIEQKGRELEIASQHKSQFLANMSHELRTPLNAILGYTELIADGIYGNVPGKIGEVLERVQKSGRHLLGLINDVLDLSKIEAGQLELSLSDYSFQDAVQSAVTAVESLANEKGLHLTVDVAPRLPVGRADERRIVQVLLNLLGNAIKFTEQGEVTVRVRMIEGEFSVSVSDTGPGIPATQFERIFEEFQQVDGSSTRTKGGSGLGLAIAKKIVELHGGRIWVESVVGKGSTFTFSVPVHTQRQKISV